ncbi:MAG: hypothetical protein KIS94_15900 [Chitinophagales bacterium]|nr:hypothetical protein [Chitinophagales bacterium]
MFSVILFIILAAVGFMMGFLYKKVFTTSKLLNPEPAKTLKIFVWFFATALVVSLALSYFTSQALGASEIAEEADMRYQNLESTLTFTIHVFYFLMIVLANAYSQSLKKFAPLPYILALGFYALFILADAYYITDAYILWQKSMQLIRNDVPDYTGAAWSKCFMALLVTAFNSLMIWWGLRK